MTDIDSMWRSPPTDLALSSNDVHVWRASLDQSAFHVQHLQQILSEDEQIRAARFHFERDRKRFIIGRGLLRTILGCYLEINPVEVQFCYGSRGKPALAGTHAESNLQFNLSHSQDICLYAVTRDRQIGVDVEYIRSVAEVETIAKRFFSARENAVLCALPAHQKQQAFLNAWTRKEAYLKAIGEGLARPLDQIEVTLAPGEPAMLLSIEGDRIESDRWSLQELKLELDYVAALAVEGTGTCTRCWQWDASNG
ncbi:4'-phosphopantetheinyl transferase superfamily protein [Coleofasciculus sp. FACHB-129]|uniref:4'-phosphopantetheinyl transferase family protein n=1 Tax=Cyanophyceae TaxID=3028117 RepID=UPI00168505E1|nr:4'-phosphopantetheinyl transferase superfamily protein [Coleofasciculus sp. FACHB-129]MBD1894539.1 4'-phosphopantetheinyl transferase superfamily protein [Coleofasciculus sp. FACHB-129]